MSIINFVEFLSNDIEQKMREDLVKYERSQGIEVNYKKFSLVLREDNNEVVGVLNAYTAFSEIYIDDMWVSRSHRGKGHGRKLIESLENYFKGRGFNNINLVTNQFNAPDFYKKCGFKLGRVIN